MYPNAELISTIFNFLKPLAEIQMYHIIVFDVLTSAFTEHFVKKRKTLRALCCILCVESVKE